MKFGKEFSVLPNEIQVKIIMDIMLKLQTELVDCQIKLTLMRNELEQKVQELKNLQRTDGHLTALIHIQEDKKMSRKIRDDAYYKLLHVYKPIVDKLRKDKKELIEKINNEFTGYNMIKKEYYSNYNLLKQLNFISY